MSIVSTPGWIGSSAVTETGQRWMSAARTELRLPASGWMSEMAGRSVGYVINVTANNTNFVYEFHMFDLWRNLAGSEWGKPGNTYRIIIHPGVTIKGEAWESSSNTYGCLLFLQSEGCVGDFIIENHGEIASDEVAIYSKDVRIQVDNRGRIRGNPAIKGNSNITWINRGEIIGNIQ